MARSHGWRSVLVIIGWELSQGSQLRGLGCFPCGFLCGTSWAFSQHGSWIPRKSRLRGSSPRLNSSRDPGRSCMSYKPNLAVSEYYDNHILLVKRGTKGSPDTREENWAPPFNARTSRELAAVFNLTTVYLFMCVSVCACV